MVEKMVKILGKIVGSFLMSFCVMALQARVTMEVRTESGVKNQVTVGQPFTLEVVVDDVYGSIHSPTINGLDSFAAKLAGTYMSSINGKSITRYSYQVRIDTLGTHLIGPAIVRHKNQELISNQVEVTVVKDPGITAQVSKNNPVSQGKAFLRLMVDNDAVVVGQKMSCALRFYYQDTSLSLHAIGIPELTGFDTKELSNLESGTAEIDGVSYKYAQWRWDMYPTKPGEFIIPAYNADYDIPLKDNNHMLGGFFMLMGSRVDRRRVYSNAVTVNVSPLPQYDGHVHAVGSFERISASIKPGIAKEGEGMVFTIEIEGSGNIHTITIPQLHLPDSLKYYDSNSTVIPPQHSDELPKKRFEFIVQGLKAGDYEIPKQIFTYFDVQRGNYVTLHTCPLAVSIMPGMPNATIYKDNVSMAEEFVSSLSVSDCDDIADINTVGQWYPIEEYQPLPLWLLRILFLMPFFYMFYPVMLDKVVAFSGNSRRLRRRRAFNQAYKKVEYCVKNNDSSRLYAIFMELFEQCGHVDDLGTEWNNFFEQIMHAAYAQSNNVNADELCRVAKQWLDRLKKNTW